MGPKDAQELLPIPNYAGHNMKFRFQHGFTLIELLVTLAVAGALLLVAVPGFQAFQRNSQLTSLINSLLVAINTTKAEAMKQNASAFVVPSDGANWANGWTVFVDKDRNGKYSANEDITVMVQEAPASYFSISGNGTSGDTVPYIKFDSSGFSRTTSGSSAANLTLTITRNDLTGAKKTEETRRIIISKSGRARSCSPSSDSSCTTTASE
ncbi:GspH/FimT family pseudopilin [Acidovorax sp. SUPP3334]|uniref:GspH/FimT family pseudopilin n=1 Tax=Acidovorax sp. SUPP3334 TaxID=2920881 RepID=UPI0023DE4920|nr:GspH/FimT family pseudopilin [Acidovorax sp. SUPP3334]GKT25256.1 GspH/FimT family pseudopilin [Acidovorax sp. SUPP3334]